MSLLTQIKDGEGSGKTAGVTSRNALKVTAVEATSADLSVSELTTRKQYREFFTTTLGSNDLNIDSSTTTTTFSVISENGITKWVTGVRFLLNGTDFELDTNDFRRFGAAATSPGLTNGIEFFVQQSGIETDFFIHPIQYVGQFMDYADGFTNFVNAVSSQGDFLSFDFFFDTPVVLPPSSSDFLGVKIRDDLSALDQFHAIARGYQEVSDGSS